MVFFCFFFCYNSIFLMKTVLLFISLNLSHILIFQSTRLLQKIICLWFCCSLFLTLEFFIYFGILICRLMLSGWRYWLLLLPLGCLIFLYCPLYEILTHNLHFLKNCFFSLTASSHLSTPSAWGLEPSHRLCFISFMFYDLSDCSTSIVHAKW